MAYLESYDLNILVTTTYHANELTNPKTSIQFHFHCTNTETGQQKNLTLQTFQDWKSKGTSISTNDDENSIK